MPETNAVLEREAAHGAKMIELKIRFWTNDIAGTPGNILPKHAWASGVVRLERNTAHGIVPGQPIPFHSLLDITAAVEKALIAHGIHLHRPRKMRHYFEV
jgi:hypothetical protein